MISAAFADKTNDTSKTTTIAENLKKIVALFTCKTLDNATVGAAAAKEEDAQHKNAMIPAGSPQSIMGGSKTVKFG